MTVRRHIGVSIQRFDRVASTNDLATQAGVAVLADSQTAGRGQYGRSWSAPAGTSVQLSVALDPPMECKRPAVLTAWAAVAVADLVYELTELHPTIKWPNDVLLVDRKIAGILIEQKSLVVVGIGLNVNQSIDHFREAALPDAGSLASVTGRKFDRDVVAEKLIDEMDRTFDSLLNGGIADLESRWRERLALIGAEVGIEMIDGVVYRGQLADVSFAAVTLDTGLSVSPDRVRRIAR